MRALLSVFPLDEVAGVGGSKGSAYGFYCGKNGLFLAAMDDTIQDLVVPLKRLKPERPAAGPGSN